MLLVLSALLVVLSALLPLGIAVAPLSVILSVLAVRAVIFLGLFVFAAAAVHIAVLILRLIFFLLVVLRRSAVAPASQGRTVHILLSLLLTPVHLLLFCHFAA